MSRNSIAHSSHANTEDDLLDEEADVMEYVIVPPDGGWGWVVVAACFYCMCVIDGIIFTFGIYLPNIANTYNADDGIIALIGSCMFGLHLAAGPLCATLTKCLGFRPTLVLGSLLAAASLASAVFDPPLWALIIFFGVFAGTGMCLAFMTCLTVTSMYFNKYRLAAMGVVVCGTGFGTLVFALAGNLLLETMSWQKAHLVLAGCALLMAPVGLCLRPLEPVPVARVAGRPIEPTRRRHSLWDEEDALSKPIVLLRRVSEMSKLSAMDNAQFALETFSNQFFDDRLFTRDRLARCCCCALCCRPSVRDYEEYIDEDVDQASNVSVNTPNEATSDDGRWTRTFIPSRPTTLWQKLKEVCSLDWSLLKNMPFALFCFSGGLCGTAVAMLFTFEKVRAIDVGLSQDMATYFVATLGGANMFWRLFLGFITSNPNISYHAINVTCHLFGGAAVIASVFSDCVALDFVLCFVSGSVIGAYAVFRPVAIVDLVGLQKINDGAGISLLFTGGLAVAGPPLGGYLHGAYGNYDIAVLICGGLFITCGMLMWYMAYLLKHRPMVAQLAPSTSST